MPDRENVITALQHCIDKPCHTNCPYFSSDDPTQAYCLFNKILPDALALLREQESRVLKYSEIEKHPLVWLEDNDKEDVIPALFLQYNGWTAEFSRQAPNKYVDTIVRSAKVVSDERTYGITWRAWSAQPTNEQRKAVKWGE